MKKFTEKILTLLWPSVCPFCGKVSREGICNKCRKETDKLRIEEPRCMKCGKPVRYKEQEYCRDCAHTHHYYDRGMGLWLHHEPVSTSIYQFKYHNQRHYAKYYAKEIDRQKREAVREMCPEAICPVPLHPRRKRKRGYNQAEILAKELGKLWGIPVEKNLVQRVCYTRPQKTLDPVMRKKNMQHAFAVRKGRSIPKKVLVIDDIYTTGNTIDEMAKVLKIAGVQKVYFLTISIGQGY